MGDTTSGARFWLNLPVPPRSVVRMIRCAPRRYRRRLIALWLWWDASG